MKKKIICLFFAAYFLNFPIYGFAQTTSFLIHRLQNKVSHLSSFTGSFLFAFQKKKDYRYPLRVYGKIYIFHHWMRMDSKIQIGSYSAKKLKSVFYLNSSGLWETVSSKGKIAFTAHADPKRIEKDDPRYFIHRRFVDFLNPAAMITQIRLKQTHFLGRSILRNHETLIFEVKNPNQIQSFNLPSGKKIKVSQIKLWIGAENGICYQGLFLNRKNQVISKFKFYHLILNPKISLTRFYFLPPKKRNVHDLTPFMEKIFKKRNA